MGKKIWKQTIVTEIKRGWNGQQEIYCGIFELYIFLYFFIMFMMPLWDRNSSMWLYFRHEAMFILLNIRQDNFKILFSL